MTTPILAIPEVPKCTIKHRSPYREARLDCTQCKNRKNYLSRLRKAQIQAGLRPPRLDRTAPRARRCPDHVSFSRGCPDCQAFARYEGQQRRRLEREGRLERKVPVELVQEYLRKLLDPVSGGWTRREVVARTGLGKNSLWAILAGKDRYVWGNTWAIIRALEPRHRPAPPQVNQVSALEVRRTVQGLAAQGWSYQHLAQLLNYASRESVSRLTCGTSPWVTIDTLKSVRDLRAKLGRYDIAVMAEPAPGMKKATATFARRFGWIPLSAWEGQDIADPDARPYGARTLTLVQRLSTSESDDPGPDNDGMPFVDPILAAKVRLAAEKISEATPDRKRRTEAYIRPLGQLTHLEMHAVIAYAGQLGLNQTHIAELLGLPATPKKNLRLSLRIINRYKEDVDQTLAWLDTHPRGWLPNWFPLGTSSRRDFGVMLPGLLAIQSAPFGPGWDVAELAEQCGTTEQETRTYLARAARAGDANWEPASQKKTAP